jgi:N-acetylneuraminic acid mutarotase
VTPASASVHSIGAILGLMTIASSATAQHFKMPDQVQRDRNMPIATLDATTPRATTSFGAATTDGWVYVLGGYTGPPHDYYMEEQQRDFYRVNLHDRSHVEYLPHDQRIQSCSLEAHGDRIFRIGGMVALNQQFEDQRLDSLDEVWAFDTKTRNWTAMPPLPSPRSSHDSTVVGSRLVVAGGWGMDVETGESDWHDDVLVMDLEDPAGDWKSIPAPFKRRALATTSIGDEVFMIGGITSKRGMSNAVEVLNLETGVWTKGPDYPGIAFGLAAEAAGDRVIASGADGVVYAWTPGETEWNQVGSLTFPRFFHQIAAASPDDLIFVGGISRGVRPAHLEHLDLAPETDAPSAVTMSIPTPMKAKNRQAMFVNDGWVYLFGGNNSVGQHDFEAENFLSTGQRFSLAGMHWEDAADFPHARQTIQTCMDTDGNAYAVGGFGHDGEAARTWTDGYRYDVKDGTWHDDAPNLPISRSQFGLVEHAGNMWVFGGLDYDPRRADGDQFRHLMEVVSAPVEKNGPDFAYDGINLPEPRRAFAGAKLGDRYYLVGGMREDFQLVENCRAFDFDSKEFMEMPAPSRPRLSAELVALDGRLYLAGGSSPKAEGSGLEPNRSIECFDPATETWSMVMEEIPMKPRHMRMMPYRGRLLLFSSHVEDEDMVNLVFVDPGHQVMTTRMESAVTIFEDE